MDIICCCKKRRRQQVDDVEKQLNNWMVSQYENNVSLHHVPQSMILRKLNEFRLNLKVE